MMQYVEKSISHRTALISLGGNLSVGYSDVTETIRKGIAQVKDALGHDAVLSHMYRTPAFPPGSGPDFVNAAMTVQTTCDGPQILAAMHRIEAAAQRTRVKRWGARTLDIDLIGLNSCVLPDVSTWQRWHDLPLQRQLVDVPDQLVLPHPRMQSRSFVLVPLADVAPDWHHPILGLTVTQMRDNCAADDLATVQRLDAE